MEIIASWSLLGILPVNITYAVGTNNIDDISIPIIIGYKNLNPSWKKLYIDIFLFNEIYLYIPYITTHIIEPTL